MPSKRKSKDIPLTFTESGPTVWTEESVRAYKEGMRILARMIAVDILKKRDAAAKNASYDTPSDASAQKPAKS